MPTSEVANNSPRLDPPPARWRLLWIPLVVWMASIFAAEGAFRLAGVRVVAAMGGFYEPFGDHNYRHKANAAAYHDWFSGVFWAYTDAMGFRVGAAERDRKPDSIDVLVLGDSQAFGQGVDYEASVVGRFAQQASGAGLTVGNAAVGGHSIRDQVEVARAMAREHGLKPKVVLITLSPRSLAYPDALSRAIVLDGALWDEPPTRRDHVRRWFASRSAVYAVGRDAARNIRNAIRPPKGPPPAADLLSIYEVGEVQDSRAAGFRRVAEDLRTLFPSASPRIVLAYFPLAVESQIESMAKGTGARVSSSAPAETAAKLAGLMGVELIDASPILAVRRTANQPITLNGDNHYGPETSGAVAELLWTSGSWAQWCGRGGS